MTDAELATTAMLVICTSLAVQLFARSCPFCV